MVCLVLTFLGLLSCSRTLLWSRQSPRVCIPGQGTGTTWRSGPECQLQLWICQCGEAVWVIHWLQCPVKVSIYKPILVRQKSTRNCHCVKNNILNPFTSGHSLNLSSSKFSLARLTWLLGKCLPQTFVHSISVEAFRSQQRALRWLSATYT